MCVRKVVTDEDEGGDNKGHFITKVDHVVEQRVSNLAQGLLTLGCMTGPLLVVVGLVPQGVLAGLFFVMGVQALEANGITSKLLFLAKDKKHTAASDPLKRIKRRLAIWVFVAIQLLGFGATFAITQTIAAIGFPVIILLLIPVRTFILPKWFTQEELSILDEPTASSFTMESVGGNFGEDVADSNATPSSNDITAVNSGSASIRRDGVLQGRTDSDEALAEQGEAPGIGMKRRESWKSEERSGQLGDSIEMRPSTINRRSFSRHKR